MSKRKSQKEIGISDTLALCGLYALLLLLFFVPGIILAGRPVSALDLMQATELHQYAGFPGKATLPLQMLTCPILCITGIILTLLLRRSSGKYAFGACISMMLFGTICLFQSRFLPHAGGFVFGAAAFISVVLFFVSIICAIIRK